MYSNLSANQMKSIIGLMILLAVYPMTEMPSAKISVSRQAQSQGKIKAGYSQFYQVAATEVLAIVSPEMLRHSDLRDFLETSWLEKAYVQGGIESADFSIGLFQMKPSFVEQLEQIVQEHSEVFLVFKPIIQFTASTPEEKRRARIARLSQLEWQIKYAFCFYKIIANRYPATTFESLEAKVKFYASAYNYGFLAPKAAIANWAKQAAFPYGKMYDSKGQAPYGEYAWTFYQYYNHSKDVQ